MFPKILLFRCENEWGQKRILYTSVIHFWQLMNFYIWDIFINNSSLAPCLALLFHLFFSFSFFFSFSIPYLYKEYLHSSGYLSISPSQFNQSLPSPLPLSSSLPANSQILRRSDLRTHRPSPDSILHIPSQFPSIFILYTPIPIHTFIFPPAHPYIPEYPHSIWFRPIRSHQQFSPVNNHSKPWVLLDHSLVSHTLKITIHPINHSTALVIIENRHWQSPHII